MPGRVHRGTLRPLGVIAVLLIGLGLPLTMPAAAEQPREEPLIGPPPGDSLHVMSYNLRFASHKRPNSWTQRRPVMAELLRREQPTVIGTQEGLYGQLKDIDEDLPDHYDWIGVGRAGGSRDEFMAVFYDTRRLEPLEFDNFWLSDTPEAVGSRSWGNRTIRMATWVRFADLRTGREFVVVNTHFDDRSAEARRRSAALIRDRINAFAPTLPVVLTGDFNSAAERSAPYEILTRGAGLADTWLTAATQRTPQYMTWHGYRLLVPYGPRIDWMLTKGAVTVEAAAINTFTRDGQFPSDHLPVQTLLRFD